jgi:hypothetical protein
MSRAEAGTPRAEPFASAEEAWFWACAALRARQEGAASCGGRVKRPCDPDDVLMCVERGLRSRRLDPAQARVLGVWGRRQMTPSRWVAPVAEAALWQDAMAVLRPMLAAKGIVADGSFPGINSLTRPAIMR